MFVFDHYYLTTDSLEQQAAKKNAHRLHRFTQIFIITFWRAGASQSRKCQGIYQSLFSTLFSLFYPLK